MKYAHRSVVFCHVVVIESTRRDLCDSFTFVYKVTALGPRNSYGCYNTDEEILGHRLLWIIPGKSVLVDMDFIACFLNGWWPCRQTIRCQVWIFFYYNWLWHKNLWVIWKCGQNQSMYDHKNTTQCLPSAYFAYLLYLQIKWLSSWDQMNLVK